MKNRSYITILFGQRIKELRLARGLSQEDLGELCSMDRTYISSLERGHRNISLKNIVALSRALQVSMSNLFEGLTWDDDGINT